MLKNQKEAILVATNDKKGELMKLYLVTIKTHQSDRVMRIFGKREDAKKWISKRAEPYYFAISERNMEGDFPDEMVEKIADLEHEQWAHWTEYMLDQLGNAMDLAFSEFRVDNPDHPVLNRAYEKLDRWRRQIKTPYSELTEQEKDSDRKWARKVLKTIAGG